jgi:hypothetical protein
MTSQPETLIAGAEGLQRFCAAIAPTCPKDTQLEIIRATHGDLVLILKHSGSAAKFVHERYALGILKFGSGG